MGTLDPIRAGISPVTKNWISNNPERTEFRGHIEGFSGGLAFAWSHKEAFQTYQACWDDLMKVKTILIQFHAEGRLIKVLEGRYWR